MVVSECLWYFCGTQMNKNFLFFLRSISTCTPWDSRMKRCWTSRSSFGWNWSKAWIGTQMPHLLWRCCQRLYGQFPTAQVSTQHPCYCDEGLFKMKNLKSRQVCLFNPWIHTCQPLRNEIIFIHKETSDPSSNLGKPLRGKTWTSKMKLYFLSLHF